MYPALPFPMAVEVHLLPISGSWFLEECSVCKQLETANPDWYVAQIYVVIHCGFEFVLNWRTTHMSSFAVGKECGDFVFTMLIMNIEIIIFPIE